MDKDAAAYEINTALDKLGDIYDIEFSLASGGQREVDAYIAAIEQHLHTALEALGEE